MRVQWKCDKITDDLVIASSLNSAFIEFLKRCNALDSEYILDWGGGEGDFTRRLASASKKHLINMDPSVVNSYPSEVLPVKGIGQKLPFKNNAFAGVHIRAALHHAPKQLDICLNEVYRVLEPHGIIMLQEPLNKNPVAWLARKMFKTERHDADEQPLDSRLLLEEMSKHFVIQIDNYHFLLSYTCLFIVSRLPFKPLLRWTARQLLACDRFILRAFPISRHLAAYIEVIGYKKDERFF